MTEQMTPAEVLAVENILLAIEHSRNFATAKPNIGSTEKEHILGLCALLERVASAQMDTERLNWLESDMAKGDDAVGIYSDSRLFVFPRVDNGAGGSGGGVYLAYFCSLREAIDAARAEAGHG